MDELIFSINLCEKLLITPIVISNNYSDIFCSFEKNHCFHKNFQQLYTETFLRDFFKLANHNTIYEFCDPLETITSFFFIEDSLIIIGPYLKDLLSLKEMENILIQSGISISYLMEYRLYRSQYNTVDPELLLRVIRILLQLKNINIEDYATKKIKGKQDKIYVHQAVLSNQNIVESINQRYIVEQEFLRYLRNGESENALTEFKKLSSYRSELYSTRESKTPALAALTAVRSTIRITAAQAGVPPAVVDAISQKYAQKTYNLTNKKNRTNYDIQDMIRDICDEIQKLKKHNYSILIKNVTNYIEVNLGSNLTVYELAEKFHVSVGYLSKRFKSETQSTIINYIMDKRCQKAAELLLKTHHSVQDISFYVGYSDNNYFVKVFKTRYGTTPTEYRKNYRAYNL